LKVAATANSGTREKGGYRENSGTRENSGLP
jgi:hypothetical protein